MKLPADLKRYLRGDAPKVLDFKAVQGVYGCALHLIPLGELRVEELHVRPEISPFADESPNSEETGHYAVPGVNLTRGWAKHPPQAAYSFIWLPTERRYATWDQEHYDLMVFRPDVTWSRIIADVQTYFQATNNGGEADARLAEYFCPWPKYPFVVPPEPAEDPMDVRDEAIHRGLKWRDQKEYDKAILEYTVAIRLDPELAVAYRCRSEAQMLTRQPAAAAKGFWRLIEIEGWQGNFSAYAVILGHLTARQAKDKKGAQRFLKDSAGKLDEAWPYPAILYLRGDINEAALLALATDKGKQTEAHCYLGLNHAVDGRQEEALTHFRWVKKHGRKKFVEYSIAAAEIERLRRNDKGPMP
jgi:tetratricopeptide (TPR) repeat protein